MPPLSVNVTVTLEADKSGSDVGQISLNEKKKKKTIFVSNLTQAFGLSIEEDEDGHVKLIAFIRRRAHSIRQKDERSETMIS